MFLPGVAAHVVQRGHNRQACFFDEEDFQTYRTYLGEGCQRHGIALHGYCLMTNHVHLLITPGPEDGFSRCMQVVNRRYVHYVNRRYRRRGTLWPLLRVPAPAAFVPPCTSGRTLQGESHRGGTLSFDLLSLH
jgi:putative transposase